MVVKPADQLKQKITELEEEKAELETKNAEQIAEIAKLRKELERQKTLADKLRSGKQQAKDQSAEMQKLEEQVLKAEDMAASIRKDLNAEKEKTSQLRSTNTALSKRLNNQEAELSKLRHRQKMLIEDLAVADKDRSKQAYEIENMKIEMAHERMALQKDYAERKKISPSFREYINIKRELTTLKRSNQSENASPRKSLTFLPPK